MYIAFSQASLAIYVIGIGSPIPNMPKVEPSEMAADLEDLSGDCRITDQMVVLLAKFKPKALASSLGVYSRRSGGSIAGEIGI